ncbi:MAG: hypothetical protein ABIG44_15845 [Planctomycetota bacterium]
MRRYRPIIPTLFLVSVGVLVPINIAAADQPWEPQWAAGLFPLPGVSGMVMNMAVFDDGGGPALYVGGDFTAAGFNHANGIARWDGEEWSAVDGLNAHAGDMAVFDDGNGPALFVSGWFTEAGGQPARGVARWDGQQWLSADGGLEFGVRAFAVFDDGGGPVLYGASNYPDEQGNPLYYIVRWDDQQWSIVSSAADDVIRTLTVYDDGGGPALHAGGSFTYAGDVEVNNIAKWDGQQWWPLGSGTGTAYYYSSVTSLAAYDDGTGLELYAGGWFTHAGGIEVNHIARWNGQTWAALGAGVNNPVRALTVFDDGHTTDLYVGGDFSEAVGGTARNVARWNGLNWSNVGERGTFNSVFSLCGASIDGDPALYVGGDLHGADFITVRNIARWDGSDWSALGSGINGGVASLCVLDGGSRAELIASGNFTTAGDQHVNRIARWNGHSWAPLGDGFPHSAGPLVSFDDGTGMALYAGGCFGDDRTTFDYGVARWDGQQWTRLGGTFRNEYYSHDSGIYALEVFDDGDGPRLYAGGAFTHVGQTEVNGIATWDGGQWQPLGVGVWRDEYPGWISALKVFDAGEGPLLVAGGYFHTAGGLVVDGVAAWDGGQWLNLGDGPGDGVMALCVFDSGAGPELYAGGYIQHAISKWDGTVWQPFDSGIENYMFSYTLALCVHDDGSGPTLYAGGEFVESQENWWPSGLLKWNDDEWVVVGGRSWGDVATLASLNDGWGPALYAGGWFAQAGEVVSAGLARWGYPLIRGDVNCDGYVNAYDISPFILALSNPDVFTVAYPHSGILRADANADGHLTLADIDPFIELLSQSPER